MRRSRSSIHVESGPDQIWALVDDLDAPAWEPVIEPVDRMTDGPTTRGTVYLGRPRVPGLRSVREWEVVEHVAPWRQVHVSYGRAIETRVTIDLAPDERGTRVRKAVEVRSRLPGPVGALVEVTVVTIARASVRSALRSVKERVERS